MICSIISDGCELRSKCRNEHEMPILKVKNKLRDTVWQLYNDGYDEFYLNCEYGIPLWTAEIIAGLKLYNNITLNIIVPFEEQCRDWSENERDRYYSVHEKADNIIFACSEYEDGCYDTANEIMIDLSELVVISGNNEAAERYAKDNGMPIRKISL